MGAEGTVDAGGDGVRADAGEVAGRDIAGGRGAALHLKGAVVVQVVAEGGAGGEVLGVCEGDLAGGAEGDSAGGVEDGGGGQELAWFEGLGEEARMGPRPKRRSDEATKGCRLWTPREVLEFPRAGKAFGSNYAGRGNVRYGSFLLLPIASDQRNGRPC